MKISKADVAVLLMLYGGAASAQAEQEQPMDEMPTVEFLEFLGSFVNEKGQFIDPMMLRESSEEKPRASDKEERKHD